LLFNEAASIRLWEEAIPFPGIASRDNVEEELLPQWRNQFSMTYRLLAHDIRLSIVSTDKFKGADRVAYIDSFHRFDLTYNYSGIENTNISLGMINILGEDPPLDPSSPNDPLVTSVYSQRGPEVFLRLTKNF
jgi:outer membrane receptor protein involved in Fe transport